MSDEIDDLIANLEALLEKKNKPAKALDVSSDEDELFNLELEYLKMLDSLKTRSEKRNERIDRVIDQVIESTKKPSGKPN